MGQDRAPDRAVDLAAGVVGGQALEPGVDDGAHGGGQRGQVRAVADRHRPDVVQATAGQVGEVVGAVLPGVEDHRHLRAAAGAPGRGGDRLVSPAELVDHRRELGDVRLVAGVGMPGQRDPAVTGDHQAQPDQPQVAAFLLRLAPLRDRGLRVRGGDEGREVGHVQRHRGDIDPADLDQPQRDRLADPLQLLRGDRVHGVPEPPVVQGAGTDLGEPVRGGGLPPVRERRLRTRGHQPVQRRQRQVGARRQRQPGRAGPDHLVDDARHTQLGQHPPGRGDVPEPQVPGAVRHDRALAGIQQRRHLGGRAHVPLRDHPRLAVHAGHLPQVPVGLAADLLRVQTRHI